MASVYRNHATNEPVKPMPSALCRRTARSIDRRTGKSRPNRISKPVAASPTKHAALIPWIRRSGTVTRYIRFIGVSSA